MTNQRSLPTPNLKTKGKIEQVVRDHGDSMLDPHWPAKHAGEYGVTAHTLRQWRRYALSKGLLKSSWPFQGLMQALAADLGVCPTGFEQSQVTWMTGLGARSGD